MAIPLDLFRYVPTPGMIMEFGVGEGHSTKILANITDRQIYAFDSFKGLPEDWRPSDPKGSFACDPPILPSNVELVIGLFEDTLPPFLASHSDELVAFAHIDCDLYSSTKTVLDCLKPRLMKGSILSFDEIWGHPSCFIHEYKAFREFLSDSKFDCETICRIRPECEIFRLI